MDKSREYSRKLFHMILGIIIGLLILYFRKRYIIAFVTGILSAGLLIRFFLLKGYKFPIFEYVLSKVGRPMEVGMGAMYFFIGVLLAVLFPFPREYAALGVIILGISDGMATIMGIGSPHKLYEGKSFEGTISFFVSSFIILILSTSLFQALFVSILLSLMELFSPVDDNIFIPPICALLLSLTSF